MIITEANLACGPGDPGPGGATVEATEANDGKHVIAVRKLAEWLYVRTMPSWNVELVLQ
jgi:hypothetical protein